MQIIQLYVYVKRGAQHKLLEEVEMSVEMVDVIKYDPSILFLKYIKFLLLQEKKFLILFYIHILSIKIISFAILKIYNSLSLSHHILSIRGDINMSVRKYFA